MFQKIKQAILLFMASICFNELKKRMEEEHDEHMQEIIDYINERIEAGAEITILVHPDMAEDKFALYSEPVPHLKVVKEENDVE